MTTSSFWRYAVCVTALGLLSGSSWAGDRTNVRGMGMGRSSTALARGVAAAGINPANLGLPGDGAFIEIALLPVGFHLGSDFLTYGLYQDYFTGVNTDSGRVGRHLNESDKTTLLDAFNGEEGFFTAEAGARPLGVVIRPGSWGAVAVTMTERLAGFGSFPKDYMKFLLYGNPPGSEYDFSGTSLSAAWTEEYAISAGVLLPPPPFVRTLAGGVSIKFVRGLACAEITRFSTRLTTSDIGVLDGSLDLLARTARIDALGGDEAPAFEPFPAPAGTGWGVDIGVTAEIREGLTAALSITDIGAVTWFRNVRENTASGTIRLDDPLNDAQQESLENAIQGDVREGSEFTTALPATIRLGVAMEMHTVPWARRILFGEMTVALDYHQGLVETAGSTTTPRFSLGAEYRPVRFVPVRAGISVGGRQGASFAFGMGVYLGTFSLDLATENIEWLFSERSFSAASMAAGMTFRF